MTITVDISISENMDACGAAETAASDDSLSSDDDVPEPAALETWASAAYLGDVPASVSILITTPEEIRRLNKQYRNKDNATNVLSFPMSSPEELETDLLGDIALCAEIINTEAESQGKPTAEHWAHMVIHGMLHLQKYDHIDDAQAEEMEQLEIKILQQFGIGNPYETEAGMQLINE